jgi:hypothetical protein
MILAIGNYKLFMKKFDNIIKDIQSTFLKENDIQDNNKIYIDGQIDSGSGVNVLRHELTQQENDNSHDVTMHNIISWQLKYKDSKSDGEGGCIIAPGVTNKLYPNVFVGSSADSDRNRIIRPDIPVTLIVTTKDSKEIVHILENDLDNSEEYNEFWKYDPTLKEKFFKLLQRILFEYIRSPEAEQYAAYTTYNLYAMHRPSYYNKTQIEKFIEIAVKVPSKLNRAKDVTKDYTDDISNW